MKQSDKLFITVFFYTNLDANCTKLSDRNISFRFMGNSLSFLHKRGFVG